MLKAFTRYEIRNTETDRITNLETQGEHASVYVGVKVVTCISWKEASNLLADGTYVIEKEEPYDVFADLDNKTEEKKERFKLEERKRYLVEDTTNTNKEIVVKTFRREDSVILAFVSEVDDLPQADIMSWTKVEAKINIGYWAVKQELGEYDF